MNNIKTSQNAMLKMGILFFYSQFASQKIRFTFLIEENFGKY